MARFTINGFSYDPLSDSGRDAGRPEDSGGSRYVLVQSKGELSGTARAGLQDVGVVIHEYVGGDTYLCGAEAARLDAIRSIPSIAWAGVYPQDLKVAASLRGQTKGSASRIVDVVLHADVDPASADLRFRVAAAARVDEAQIQTGVHKYRIPVEEPYLADLAAIDEVRQIQEVIETGLSNNVAGPIIGGTVVVNGTPYQGDGEVIAVADTGFDMGSTTNVHAAFTGRVAALYDLGRPNQTNDPDGHGTHVAGSALGDGNSASMGGAIQGTAPQARLVVQSLLDSNGGLDGIPADLHDLFRPPYDNDGARVHTNSWNTMRAGVAYDTRASEIDDFVWTHQDMTILYCAGNYGTDADADGVVDDAQIGAEAAAKNAITVGACESNRGSATWRWGTYVDNRRPGVMFNANPIDVDQVCNDADGMAGFSSRGPTQEQRFKPDVVAPGTCILSTRSRALTSVGTGWGTSSDNGYHFLAGTSMATPLTAGCAAVLRETLVKNGWTSPPAAVIKALLDQRRGRASPVNTPHPKLAHPRNNHSGLRVGSTLRAP